MPRIEKSIELDVPVRAAYNQITQFEKYPQFMSHVRDVRQIDDTHLHWRAEVGGKEIEWDAEIYEQVPDQRIAWRSTEGSRNNGEVSFTPLGENRTRLTYVLDLETSGDAGKKGSKPEELAARTEQDLQSFKRFIESQGGESGAWRGEVHGGQVQGSQQAGAQGGQPAGGDASRAQSQGEQAADALSRAGRTAADQTSQLGKRAFETVGDNFSRASQQVSEFASQAWRSQQAIQSSAFEAANAALRPFRSGALGSQPWFSSMLHAFEEPLGVMRRFSEEMQHELDGILERNKALLSSGAGTLGSAWSPSVDVSQQDGQLTVHADLPGIRREDVSVEVDAGHLVIRGERRNRQERNAQGQHRLECSYGSFTRVIPLPDEVNLDQAEATVADGVLEIKLPLLSAQQRTHRIEVRHRDEQQSQRQAENAADAAPARNNQQKGQTQRNAA